MNKDDFKLFINFLKLSHSYNKYKNNFYKKKTYLFNPNFFERNLDCWITTAFGWSFTEEGYKYWGDLAIEWDEYLRILNKA